MAERLNNNDEVMIQLPWTVPQQSLYIPYIEVDPTTKKIPLDIQHSTDTTAIWSFVIAMVVAFILGISATIIAIWYGRKSFKLTEMSFETVIKQIYASEKVSLELNEKLFEQQKILQKNELEFKNRLSWESQVREVSSEYMMTITELLYQTAFFNRDYINQTSIQERKDPNSDSGKHLLLIKGLHLKAITLLGKFDQYFSSNDLDRETLVHLADTFNELFYHQIQELYEKTQVLNLGKNQLAYNELVIVKHLFSSQEMDEYKKLTIVQVLSKLMRKINDSCKVILNKKAA